MTALSPEHVHLDETDKIGALLKRRRKAEGLRPEVVARRAGIDGRTLRRLEAGTTMAQVERVADVFRRIGFRVRLELVPLEGGEE